MHNCQSMKQQATEAQIRSKLVYSPRLQRDGKRISKQMHKAAEAFVIGVLVVLAEGSDEEGTPADEADVDSKQDGLESAIWRLTAGNGMRPAATAGSREGSGGGSVAAQPFSERKTAAGRIDFVLQACLGALST